MIAQWRIVHALGERPGRLGDANRHQGDPHHLTEITGRRDNPPAPVDPLDVITEYTKLAWILGGHLQVPMGQHPASTPEVSQQDGPPIGGDRFAAKRFCGRRGHSRN